MSFSVLLSVYAKEQPDYFNQAFLSIWDQQILKPDQIVLVKDGPLTAELDAEIQRWQEKLGEVLTVVELPENVGLGAALNEGLKACRHELIARMDTDDISLPLRFEKQVAFMQTHHDVTASSAGLEEWNENLSLCTGKRQLPTDPVILAKFARKRSPLSHPVSIFRKSDVLAIGGYPSLRKAQDYGLWSLLLTKGYKLANLSDFLLQMRTGNDLFVRRGADYLKHELALLHFQKRTGFLQLHEFIINYVMKASLRLSPAFVKKIAYRYLR